MLSTIGRAAVRRVVAGGPQSTNRAFHSIWQVQRATLSKDGDDGLLFIYRRSYATATKAVAKPKSKSTTATKAKMTAKPSAKKTATKKATKVAAKRAVKKPVKKKIVAKPKKPIRKVLTPEEKERKVITALKKQALSIPTRKPDSAWMVYIAEQLKKVDGTPGGLATKMPVICQAYKNLSPAELEVRIACQPCIHTNCISLSTTLQTKTNLRIKWRTRNGLRPTLLRLSELPTTHV
jgi:hypothetical protein